MGRSADAWFLAGFSPAKNPVAVGVRTCCNDVARSQRHHYGTGCDHNCRRCGTPKQLKARASRGNCTTAWPQTAIMTRAVAYEHGKPNRAAASAQVRTTCSLGITLMVIKRPFCLCGGRYGLSAASLRTEYNVMMVRDDPYWFLCGLCDCAGNTPCGWAACCGTDQPAGASRSFRGFGCWRQRLRD